jgi:alpha-tubulin suppressor-like RCC1 family protein
MEMSRSDARMIDGRGFGGRLTARRRLAVAVLILSLSGLAAGASAFAEGTFFPVIKKQPVSVVVEEGHPATFESTASGLPTPMIQWETSTDGGTTWKNVAKATSTVLTIAKPKNTESGTKFRAHFKNTQGEATSEAATMTVAEPPKVTKQPTNLTVNEGAVAVFEAAASAVPAATVQWEVSTDSGSTWNPIPGAVFVQLAISESSSALSGNQYRARFTNAAGNAVTNAATLTVQSIAVVTLQPESVTVLLNGNTHFESAAHGFPAPTVQWEVSTNSGATWSSILGATSNLLPISAAQLAQNGNEYRAAFANAAGTSHSEAASLFVSATDYGAFGWGLNSHGETGVGSNETSILSPRPIGGLGFVTAVASGMRHSLALLANGTVESWGSNAHGQLGDKGIGATRSPVAVEHLKGVAAIAAGGSDSLALLSNGTVMAWGDGESGQVGNGKSVDSEVPVAVEGLTNVTAIAAGEEHSLALLSNGTVMAWGAGERGQLGTGSKASHNSPVAVKGLSGVTAIAAAGQYSLALLSDGTVVAWGDDQHGQLGNQAILEEESAEEKEEKEEKPALEGEEEEEKGVDSTSPIPVEGLSGVSSIAAGRIHALALLSGGTVEAWGDDTEGELGNATIKPQANTPVPVTGLSSVTAVSAGDQESVALLSTGGLEAWGANSRGGLGDGVAGEPSDVPVAVHSINGAAGVSAGGSHMVAFGAALPTVTSISPQNGPTGGGASVTITGAGLGGATAVHFGAAAATGLTVNSPSSVTVTSPAGTGTVDVTVTTPSGTSPPSSGDRYSYRPAPTLLKLSAKGGPAAGGTILTITGTEFSGATEVDFGAVAVTTLTVNSNTSITVTSPANVAGTTDVRVETLSGLSATTTKDHFKYSPSIESVSPANGLIAGGATVTITGTGFIPGTSATTFKFGKAKAKSAECTSTTTCLVVVPAAKTAGTIDIQATAAKVKSTIAVSDHFTYE